MRRKRTLFVTQAAMIAALYVVLTMIANAFGLANYAIQLLSCEVLATINRYPAPRATQIATLRYGNHHKGGEEWLSLGLTALEGRHITVVTPAEVIEYLPQGTRSSAAGYAEQVFR